MKYILAAVMAFLIISCSESGNVASSNDVSAINMQASTPDAPELHSLAHTGGLLSLFTHPNATFIRVKLVNISTSVEYFVEFVPTSQPATVYLNDVYGGSGNYDIYSSQSTETDSSDMSDSKKVNGDSDWTYVYPDVLWD